MERSLDYIKITGAGVDALERRDPKAMESVAASLHEIAESRRRCWKDGCDRTARLEQSGWRYCIPHYWTQVLSGCDNWGLFWIKLRFTEIARK